MMNAATPTKTLILIILIVQTISIYSMHETSLYLGQQLYAASARGDIDRVQELIECGAPVNFRSPASFTSLHAAAKKNHEDVVRFLIARGADVDAFTLTQKSTPLHLATRKGHVAIVRVLCEAGADVNPEDEQHWQPILIADLCNYHEVIKILRSFGAPKLKHLRRVGEISLDSSDESLSEPSVQLLNNVNSQGSVQSS
jgi:ankyrin repeat protein